MIPRLVRLPLLALLCLQAGFIELRAESEWRPWFEKIRSRLGDTLNPQQRSALGQPRCDSSKARTRDWNQSTAKWW